MRRSAVLVLLALLLVSGCDDESETAVDADRTPMPILTWQPTPVMTPTPMRMVPTPIDGNVPLCGISIDMNYTNSRAAPNTAARRCLLEATTAGPAQMLFVEFANRSGVATLLTATAEDLSGSVLVMEDVSRFATSVQYDVQCADLVETNDGRVFQDPDCSRVAESSPQFDPASPDAIQMCGASFSMYSDRTSHEAARRCFLDAYEAGAAARIFDIALTVEGDPIVFVYTTRDGAISTYADSHDVYWLQGDVGYECARLEPSDPPAWFAVTDCTEPEPITP